MPVFPPEDPDDEIDPQNIRLPRWLWRRLDEIAKAEGKSRNFVVDFFLKWAVDDYAALHGKGKKK